ncbi:50S ribosomal protein L10 [Thalassoglobus polymorphus]|uniref:Large ribosomal subunit protein uL10 n=1 Tax=Thalassoglobus polymorphus TaxID=2527994 RepID=A0A517QSM9_9PLAN|nr:50S ribosomal protein L10 [Thalassoglobus polymorphus]QDT34621.1 50S ribosomal protein L10 [Thalassoglobus polymorphus]
MSKVVKKMMLDDLRNKLDGRRDFLVLDLSKLDAVANNEMRLELAQKGITLLGIKNRLLQVILRDAGLDELDGPLSGPSTLAWGGEDIVGLSREMTNWAKKIEEVEIKGAAVDGQGVDSAGVTDISKGPSRLELIGQLAGLVLSPGAQLAGALLGPGGTLSGQVQALAEKDNEESGDAA